jgi:phosphoserine phosphatase
MNTSVVVAAGALARDPALLNRLEDLLTQANFKLLRIETPKAFVPTTLLEVESDNKNELSFKENLLTLSAQFHTDLTMVPSGLFSKPKKLVVFDMDSTLITAEVIDEMAQVHGVGDQVKLITARAMNGELNFDQSLTERVALLKGFERAHMEAIKNTLKFTPGTEEFLRILRSRGIKTAIASGGFEYFAESVKGRLSMDYAFSNKLDFDGDKLSGRITSSIVNAETKKSIIEALADELGLSQDEIVAIGDGANDIPMLLTAGMGIAIHAKEKVRKAANFCIQHSPMTAALSFMNMWE